MTVPRGYTKLPKTKLQTKREDRANILSLSQVLRTSRFHLKQKSLSLTLFYSQFIILCTVYNSCCNFEDYLGLN